MLRVNIPPSFISSIHKVRKVANTETSSQINLNFPTLPTQQNVCKVKKVTFVIPNQIKSKQQKVIYQLWKNDINRLRLHNKTVSFELKRVAEVLPVNFAKCLVEYVDSSVAALPILRSQYKRGGNVNKKMNSVSVEQSEKNTSAQGIENPTNNEINSVTNNDTEIPDENTAENTSESIEEGNDVNQTPTKQNLPFTLTPERLIRHMISSAEAKEIDMNYYNYLQYRKAHPF